MDFFSHQDEARKKSQIFFVSFFLAVLMAVFILYFVATGCIGVLYYIFAHMRNGPWPLPAFIYGSPTVVLAWGPFFKVAPFLFATILTISLLRASAIKKGGAAYIAELLGGGELEQPATQSEKRFQNVVSEMSVASGLPCPRLYIMSQEKSINAVTAGLDHDDTMIAITQGALDNFDREELQAVIAHEFAHISNGDYALNLTMAGWLYGLLFFSARGRDLMRMGSEIGGRAAAGPIVVGFILWAGGWAGKLAAQLLEAAFSRQREYMADAFAVQFTRNPAALAGALKKIAGLSLHGVIRTGQSMAMQSFFIVSPARANGLLRTHPPLQKRIARLDPSWDGIIHSFRPDIVKVEELLMTDAGPQSVQGELAFYKSGQKKNMEINSAAWGVAVAALAGENSAKGQAFTDSSLNAHQQSLATASSQTMGGEADTAEALRQASFDPQRAPALILALFLKDDEQQRHRQGALIAHFFNEAAASEVLSFKALIDGQSRFSILSLAAPTLKLLPADIKRKLMRVFTSVINENGGADMMEVAALCLVKKYLNFKTELRSGPVNAAAIQADVVTVLCFAAVAGCGESGLSRQAFAAGAAHFVDWPPLVPDFKNGIDSDKLSEALERLIYISEDIRKKILLAVYDVLIYDKVAIEVEYDVLMSLSTALEVPLPYFEGS